jgi:hypothetical protein
VAPLLLVHGAGSGRRDRARPHSVVLIDSSPPGEVQGFNAEVTVAAGTFDPEALYGRFPGDLVRERRVREAIAEFRRRRRMTFP